MQKKTFTKWINSHLGQVSCRISDLYTDLRDGYLLTKLLEVLSGEQLVWGSLSFFRGDCPAGWREVCLLGPERLVAPVKGGELLRQLEPP